MLCRAVRAQHAPVGRHAGCDGSRPPRPPRPDPEAARQAQGVRGEAQGWTVQTPQATRCVPLALLSKHMTCWSFGSVIEIVLRH